MKNTKKILGIALLVCLVTVLTLTLVEFAPTIIATVGWCEMASVGWVGA